MSYSYQQLLREFLEEQAKQKEERDVSNERIRTMNRQHRKELSQRVMQRSKANLPGLLGGEKYKLKWYGGEVSLVRRYDKKSNIEFTADAIAPWRTSYMKNVIFRVGLSERGRSMAALFPALQEDFNAVMLMMYNAVFGWVRRHQEAKIPSDTGALRRSLMRSLTLSRRYIPSGEIIIEIGSPLAYLQYVNEMPTYPRGLSRAMVEELGIKTSPGGRGPHLRHPPHLETHRFSKRGGELYDPKAIHHFMESIVNDTRAQSERFFREALTQFGFYNRWKDVFGWTHYGQMYALFERDRW